VTRRSPAAGRTRGSLRVIAGSAGGRRLDAPPGTGTRPTPERVREATFNALESLGVVVDASVLDAFAGSGALGLEALSRGAGRATFVEADGAARSVVADNVAAIGFGDRAEVQGGDGVRAAARGPWDLVLLDPPYAWDRWDELWVAVVAGLADDGVAVAESDRELDLPAGLHAIRTKRYGSTVVTFASPAGAPS
jgi:16S rRNA (guanine966-N2)-methyltransferase